MKIWIYLLTLSDDSLYIGVTNNIKRRLNDHRENRGSIFTWGKEIIKNEIIWSGEVANKYQALLIENTKAEEIRARNPFKKVNGGTLSAKYKKIITKKAFTGK
jgi:predicted GIY-YIG superfamily endonuclease